MRYLVAKDTEGALRPNWFSVHINDDGRKYHDLAKEEYLGSRDAKRARAEVVEVEIMEVSTLQEQIEKV